MTNNKGLIPFSYFLHTNNFSAPMLGTEIKKMRLQPTHALYIKKTDPYRSRNDAVLMQNWRNGVCIRECGNPLGEMMALPWMGKDPERR